jgi:hypothetical protein
MYRTSLRPPEGVYRATTTPNPPPLSETFSPIWSFGSSDRRLIVWCGGGSSFTNLIVAQADI